MKKPADYSDFDLALSYIFGENTMERVEELHEELNKRKLSSVLKLYRATLERVTAELFDMGL